MIYAGHHMAERVPQNGRYFQFLRMVLISTFSRSPCVRSFLSRSLSLDIALILFSIALPYHPFCLSPCAIPLLLFRLSLTYYWKAIVFSRRRFSYGAAIFHDPILERARTRDAEAAKEKGRKRAGWQTGITGGNTGAFNMQLPSTLPEGKTSRKIGANTRASSGSRPYNSELRFHGDSWSSRRRRDQFSRFLKFCNATYLQKRYRNI